MSSRIIRPAAILAMGVSVAGAGRDAADTRVLVADELRRTFFVVLQASYVADLLTVGGPPRMRKRIDCRRTVERSMIAG